MMVGATCGESSISETAALLGFSYTKVSKVYSELCEEQKQPVTGNSVGGNTLLMIVVTGQLPDLLKLTGRPQV